MRYFLILAVVAISGCDAQLAQNYGKLCSDYGFNVGSTEHAACVQREVFSFRERLAKTGQSLQNLDRPQPSVVIFQ